MKIKPILRTSTLLACLSLLAILPYTVFGQDFSRPATESNINIRELQTRLIKGKNLQETDQLLIDALMDHNWMVNSVYYNDQRTATKFVDCSTLLSEEDQNVKAAGRFIGALLGVGTGSNRTMGTMSYNLKQTKQGTVVRATFSASYGCDEIKEPSAQQKLYGGFWNAVAKSLFIDGANLDTPTAE